MGLREQMRTIKSRDPSVKRTAEIFLYPSFWAMFNHRIAHFLYKRRLFFLARTVSVWSRFTTGIDIHPGAVIGRRFFIDHGAGVVIGETCVIGDDVLVYQGVTLGGTGKDCGKRHPTIGNNVLVGAGAKILGPFTVGNNARIGAGSVVLSAVPANSTVVGIPGSVVPSRGKKCDVSTLDTVSFPDPVSMEFKRLLKKIDDMEKRIKQMTKEAGNENS